MRKMRRPPAVSLGEGGLAECPVPDQVTTEQNAWGKPVGSLGTGRTRCLGAGG